MAPRFACHKTQILLDKRLFKRIDDLFERRATLKLDEKIVRVLERHHLEFVRAGARLSPAEKSRVKEINARLATLVTQFMQNVLKDEQSWRLVLDGENDLAGLPPTLRESAERAAADAGLKGNAMITLARSSIEGFLTYSSRRDLREQAFNAWITRGAHAGDTDNRQIVAEAVALRGEYASLMGFKSFADFTLQDTMAKTPDAVSDLLHAVWRKAVERAGEERDALVTQACRSGDNAEIMPWDWRYYSEKVRKAKYDFDEAKLQPYLELDNMIRGGLRLRVTPVRLAIQRAPGLAALSSRNADLGGARQEWVACRPFHRRLFRTSFEAIGRVDVELSAHSTSSAKPRHRSL